MLSREVAVPTQYQKLAAAVAAKPLRPIPHKLGLSAGHLDADSEPSELAVPKVMAAAKQICLIHDTFCEANVG